MVLWILITLVCNSQMSVTGPFQYPMLAHHVVQPVCRSQLFYVVSLYIEVAQLLFYLDFNIFISVLINEKHLSATLAMTIKGKRSQLTKQLLREPNRNFLILIIGKFYLAPRGAK